MKLIPTLAAVYILALIIAGHYFDPFKLAIYGLLIPMLVCLAYMLADMLTENMKDDL